MFNAMKAAAARAFGRRSPSPISSSPPPEDGSISGNSGSNSKPALAAPSPAYDPIHYFLFEKIPGDSKTRCTDETHLGNNEYQCIKSSEATGVVPRQILLKYHSTKKLGELLHILKENSYDDETIVYKTLATPRIGTPYGYVELNLDNGTSPKPYLIVPLQQKTVPNLKIIVYSVPESTKMPDYCRLLPLPAGGRRRTRSRFNKKRHSTRRSRN